MGSQPREWPLSAKEILVTEKADQFIAKASTSIDAPPATVWEALVNPEMIKQYMFGTNVVTDWKRAARSSGRVSGRASCPLTGRRPRSR